MKKVQKIKGFQTQINTLKADIDVLEQEIRIKKESISQKVKQITQLESEIKKIQVKGELKVSEHALVRYLERVKGFDIPTIEKEIVNEKVRGLVSKFTNGTFPAGGFSVVVKDNTVVTIHK